MDNNLVKARAELLESQALARMEVVRMLSKPRQGRFKQRLSSVVPKIVAISVYLHSKAPVTWFMEAPAK